MGAKEQFIELLQEELVLADRMRRAWTDLREKNAQLRDKDDNLIATAEEMVQKCIAKENELRAFIEQIKAL